MNDVVKTAWADAKINKDFISVKTFSGYRSSQADPQGVEHFFSPDVADKELGFAVLDALAHSRFVLRCTKNAVIKGIVQKSNDALGPTDIRFNAE
jgi:hypothetical protein